MPLGRFALGASEEERTPKGYQKKNVLIPLFNDEKVIAVGTEPFDDFDQAEEFRNAIKNRKSSSTRKPRRKRQKKQLFLADDPLGSGAGSENSVNEDSEESEDTGLFSENPESFF
jgi:hypothetical protein